MKLFKQQNKRFLDDETGETGVNNDDKKALINARNFLKIFTTVIDYNVKFNLNA